MSFFEYILSPFEYVWYFCSATLYYYKTYQNFFHVTKNKYRKKFPINAILKNGEHIQLNYDFEALAIAHGFKNSFKIENGILYLQHNNFHKIAFSGWDGNGDIFPIFFGSGYDELSVCDKDVIDIGANIGDSAIYFVLKGANKVIALEPMPKNHQLAKKNIQINGMSDKIELLLAGCGSKTSTIYCNPDTSGIVTYLDETSKSETSINIPIITLGEILKHSKSDSCVLKMDCEGHEYDIILNTPKQVLERFTQITMEYHYGYKNLKEKLEKCGFKVTVTKPSSFRTPYGMHNRTFIGNLFATK
jgi:FkbM family methyltransferase